MYEIPGFFQILENATNANFDKEDKKIMKTKVNLKLIKLSQMLLDYFEGTSEFL